MNPTQLSIITADDHPLLLRGLNDFLTEKGYPVIGSATNGKEAFELIQNKQPKIAILDIEMPELTGLEVAKKCKTNGFKTKIVLITLHKEPELLSRARELNIFGYLLKELALEEIEHCLKSVCTNTPYFSKAIAPFLSEPSESVSILSKLTPSEIKILKLIAKNLTNKEIGDSLFISHRTVEKHRSNIIAKLELEHKTNTLLLWAKQNHDKLN